MWYESSVKSQGRPATRSAIVVPGRRHDLAPAGDLGAEVGGQLAVQVANQRLGAGGARLSRRGRGNCSKAEIAGQVP